MTEFVNPRANHKPLGAYSHSVKVPHDVEWLVISGQVGINVKGQLQAGPRKQAEQVFRNILTCLKENGMAKKHLVKLTTFVTDPRFIEDYRAARKKLIGDTVVPASTLLVVDGLARPDIVIEIEGLAAKS
mgnify:CR=1 FL=1